jgi:hypothetical protein
VVTVTARGLVGALLTLLLGVAAGAGAAYATKPGHESVGTPVPVHAAGPDVPTDDPYAEDIDYPALEPIAEFDRRRIGNAIEDWEYPVPTGWVGYSVPGEDITPPGRLKTLDEVRFRPADEPLVGGYSLRVKALDNHKSPLDERNVKLADFERIYDDVEVLEQDDEWVYFRFRAENNTLRYNFFHWFAAPGVTEATLEMSVAGRQVDEAGLRDLFEQFAAQVRPVD